MPREKLESIRSILDRFYFESASNWHYHAQIDYLYNLFHPLDIGSFDTQAIFSLAGKINEQTSVATKKSQLSSTSLDSYDIIPLLQKLINHYDDDQLPKLNIAGTQHHPQQILQAISAALRSTNTTLPKAYLGETKKFT
eukprot:CAMPEP_0201550984 /NCGR_PEP_ID=MMETSP0173_2-20130828/7247_1 /ASSEMBLY_ACC=CAM_ASM_000268 /TAXON_ID=218659 /ORGANISM="Vexillifera sp., Strain DIVA3 564/2" /LENGTH=138 /DNA_ID=CAMNT_0047961121 /DNA_START=191 /DNA_END=607 /DNA_ORIENTATION=+